MRHTLILLVCVVFALLVSCSSTEWVHPHKSKDRFADDQQRCEEKVLHSSTVNQASSYQVMFEVEQCLKELGWVERRRR